MAFDDSAVTTMIDKVVSHASALGIFRAVNSHEPKAPPGSGIRYSVWAQRIEPLPQASGLAATAGYVVMNGRIFSNMLQKPEDEIDPRIIRAATALIAAYSGDFDFGGSALSVDLLGMYGEKLQAVAGYIPLSDGMYRVMSITIPIIYDAMWSQVP